MKEYSSIMTLVLAFTPQIDAFSSLVISEKRTFGSTASTSLRDLFDDDIEPEESKRIWNADRLFEFDRETGREVNDLLQRNPEVFTSDSWREMMLHVEEYPRLDDSQVLLVAEKTKCNPVDADLALVACKGDTMEAMVAIGLAQRSKLNAAVALPSQEEVGKVDWDEELKKLNKEQSGEGDAVRRSLGLDGEEKRKADKRKKIIKDDMKSYMDNKVDQQWLPGKSNPNPVDDEPWFTG